MNCCAGSWLTLHGFLKGAASADAKKGQPPTAEVYHFARFQSLPFPLQSLDYGSDYALWYQ